MACLPFSSGDDDERPTAFRDAAFYKKRHWTTFDPHFFLPLFNAFDPPLCETSKSKDSRYTRSLELRE